jgi:alanine dehydrogenase
MNIGVLRDNSAVERRVALTPPVVRDLIGRGNSVWVETGAGDGAKFPDEVYVRAGAEVVYSAPDVIRHSEVVLKVAAPKHHELAVCHSGMTLMAFYHMAVAEKRLFDKLMDCAVTSIGFEIIEADDGRLPVLAAVSEIAGEMTVPLAAHLLRTSSGGPGILLGGSSGVPPAHVVVIGAGVVGTWAARTAVGAGARVTVFDINTSRLREIRQHLPAIATSLSEPESIAAAVASADVVIGAVLVSGSRTPHVVTREMTRSMRPGSVIIDVAIDEGGCVETSRPTSLLDPTFVCEGVTHYCVPNLTADMSRSASTAIAHAVLPYLVRMAGQGVERALCDCSELARAVYTHGGECVRQSLAQTFGCEYVPLVEALATTGKPAAGPSPQKGTEAENK